MAENRLARDLSTRDTAARKRSWVRPELLPTPNAEPGWEFHWVRVSTMGTPDAMNVSSKLREGWEPVKATDHPEVHLPMTEDQRFKDNIVVGGLMLCKTPAEMVSERNAYYTGQADAQIKSVDNNFMRENDPRMPLFADKRSKVTFGTGS
jgi:hypothetical protein